MVKCFFCGEDVESDVHKMLCLSWKKELEGD